MRTIFALLIMVVVSGCATAHHSHMSSELEGPAAGKVAQELVTALSNTAEANPASKPLCVEPAENGAAFERALRANLRLAGYAVWPKNEAKSAQADQECLAFLGEERLLADSTTKAGVYCLCLEAKSICREYRLPDMQPVSSLSVAGFTYSPRIDPDTRSKEQAQQSTTHQDDGKVTLNDTHTLIFGRGSAILSAASRAKLVRLANAAKPDAWKRLRVTGISIHPRLGGSVELARSRATQVADVLGRFGPTGTRIETAENTEQDISGQGMTRGVVIQVFGQG